MVDSPRASLDPDRQEALRASYAVEAPNAARLLKSLKEQFETIVDQNEISLGVPIETRVKDLSSVLEKFRRKQTDSHSISSISDLAGMRIITLFQEDVDKLDKLIKQHLDVVDHEDVLSRLGDNHFGYRSNHYVVKLPDNWLSLPSNLGLDKTVAEIQVRTLPQHMWAAASHKLQYKREESVPIQLRRAISRVSAILEMVDLEFSRVLSDRANYVINETQHLSESSSLNVDILSKVLEEFFPDKNKVDDEEYNDLLLEIKGIGINDVGSLRNRLALGKDAAMRMEKYAVANYTGDDEDSDRLARGIYFTHVGLARGAIWGKLSL
ncbi:GTP pyrophosphokinase [Sphingomonas trueperi]|uniref:GTP pyrophosphokinase n=1 Tax=Sphingomonas trueperi TaxID=53317 RepID=UPI000EAE9AFA